MNANEVLELLMFYNQLPFMPQIIFAGMHSPFIQQAAIAKFGRATPTFVDLALVMAEFLAANSAFQIPCQVPTSANPAPAPAPTNATPTNTEFDEALLATLVEIPDSTWNYINEALTQQ